MKLAFDIDGIFADFNTSMIDRTIKVTGRDLFPERPFDIPCWDYPQHYGYTEAEVSAVWNDIVKDNKFWQMLFPYDGTIVFLDELRGRALANHDDVYFITSRPGIDAKRQTERWLRACGWSDTPTVLISSRKGHACRAVDADFYIDDKPDNLFDVRCETPKTVTMLLNQPWNVKAATLLGVTRCSTLMETLPVIDSLRAIRK